MSRSWSSGFEGFLAAATEAETEAAAEATFIASATWKKRRRGWEVARFPGIRNLWSKTPPGDETNLHSEIWADSDIEVDLIKRDSLSKVKYEAKTRLQLQF